MILKEAIREHLAETKSEIRDIGLIHLLEEDRCRKEVSDRTTIEDLENKIEIC